MQKQKITVVIEAPTAPLGLGMEMAGGRITSLSQGDKIEVAEQYEPTMRTIRGTPQKVRTGGIIPPIPGSPA